MATRLNRRRFLTSSGGAAAAALGVASAARVAPIARAAQSVELTFWTPHTGIYCGTWEQIVEEYTKIAPQVTFDKVQCGAGEQSYKEVLLARIAAGNPADVSVVWDTPVSYAVRGALLPLDEMMAGSQNSAVANWPPSVLASCQFEGTTYGFPTMVGVYGIYFNQEWFEQQGLPSGRDDFPKTWDELRRLSKEFTRWNGDELETAGFIPDWSEAETFPIWAALNGGSLFDPDNLKYTIDAEPNVAALDYAVAWLDEEYKGDFAKVQRDVGWDISPGEEGQPPAFQLRRLAATVGGSWNMTSIYEEGPIEFERWELASFPYGPGGTQTSAGFWPNWFVLPKGTDVEQEAFDFVDWINGEGIRTWFTAYPDIPPSTKFDRTLLPGPLVEKRGQEFAQSAMAYWYNQLDVSTPMWTSPVEEFSIDQVRRALERVFNKVAKPQEALAEAQKASQAELERVLRS